MGRGLSGKVTGMERVEVVCKVGCGQCYTVTLW
ncbi:hypothetical protein CLU86_3597 [Acidovorax sp. 62]|nr:hypothetical protein CLU86_3597 [Acidovorax sp. 62]